MLAYDALWYAQYTNKRILVVTPDPAEFNKALSEYSFIEHDTSEIVVSDEYQSGHWFMCILDAVEQYTESQLRDLMLKCSEASMVWISSRLMPETHFLQQLMRQKRKDKHNKNGKDWWIVVGEKNDSYRESVKQVEPVEDIVEGQPY